LSPQEVLQIETKYGISLSEEYKVLLTQFGNGGTGPGYGLVPLSLKHIHPPYAGTDFLLRNWTDPGKLDIEMVDSDEISGYIKLFNYGCGSQTCLIVNGVETGSLIFFDSDECFYKLKHNSILQIYEQWLENELTLIKRVYNQIQELPLATVIDLEWKLENYFIKDIILSLINASPITGGHSRTEIDQHLKKEFAIWKSNQ
jgi:hypothetical protein